MFTDERKGSPCRAGLSRHGAATAEVNEVGNC